MTRKPCWSESTAEARMQPLVEQPTRITASTRAAETNAVIEHAGMVFLLAVGHDRRDGDRFSYRKKLTCQVIDFRYSW